MKRLTSTRRTPSELFRTAHQFITNQPRRLGGEFLRYIVAGVAATLTDFTVLMALTSGLGWHYLSANTCSFLVGNAVSYLISVYWVFESRSFSSKTREFFVFVLIGLGGLGISQLTIYSAVEIANVHFTVGKVISVVATLFWNFAIKKLVLFNGVSADASLSPANLSGRR